MFRFEAELDVLTFVSHFFAQIYVPGLPNWIRRDLKEK
jgi:hypothetical protein